MLKRLVLLLIRFYQKAISPLTPPSCRFYPSCSHYGYQSIERFGLFKGGWLAVRRVGRCHPFTPGGYDPVPEQWLGLWAKTDLSHLHEQSAEGHEHEHDCELEHPAGDKREK